MDHEFDIAIVGMACRFPGANGLAEYWRNLVEGVESIARLTDSEILAAGVPAEWLSRPDYVKAAPVLDDPSLFDAAFFGYSPAEAATMDPQHRILLELTHSALEDAACDPARFSGRIGVFAGSALNTYFTDRGLNRRLAEEYIPTLIVNDKDFLATRISYKLGLRGPSLTVQTACSTSLVAVHLARQSLLNQESDLALVGAVSVRVPHRAGYFNDGAGVVSADGHVRAFDATANGTVFGSGAGVVVLRRLSDARADGDHVYAVIKGSAVNNDGSAKAGYTAPSVDGQAEVIVEALANAGVSADDISCVEAHGSGTPVGDPIEILALTKAFRSFTQRRRFCAIGSAKTNVGHLDAAAGMAGLIKMALALHHRKIPPSLHFTTPNPEIDFPSTPFFVNTRTADWRPPSGICRAGVMSTGMGGTNAHLVLEQAPAPQPRAEGRGSEILLWSARTPEALETVAKSLGDFLGTPAAQPGNHGSAPAAPGENGGCELPSLAEAAHTLQVGRTALPLRRFAVVRDMDEAVAALRSEKGKLTMSPAGEGARRPVVFMFPGVGDHYVGMAEGLYERFGTFRQEVDRCAEILRRHLGLDIRGVIYPQDRPRTDAGKAPGIDLKKMLRTPGADAIDPATERLDRTVYCQPALFTVEYALAQLWVSWGVRPDRIVGHSMGEYVAACLAGVFTLEDALRLIAVRARLVNELPRGEMLGVMLAERELTPLLDPNLSISLINGPNLCVVAGPAGAVAGLKQELAKRDVVWRSVRNAHAFHSRMLDPIAVPYEAEVRRTSLHPPSIPFISNVTGAWIRDDQAIDPGYWVDHARRTARFGDALGELWNLPDPAVIEVGPGRTLAVLANQHPARPADGRPVVVASLRHDYEYRPDPDFILNSAGQLWASGVEVVWTRLSAQAGTTKISLPTYPFERQRHWLDDLPAMPAGPASPAGRRSDLAQWAYVPSWQRMGFAPADAGSDWRGTHWLILGDAPPFLEALRQMLSDHGAIVHLAKFARQFRRLGDNEFEIGAADAGDYIRLIDALGSRLDSGFNVLHCGCLSDRPSTLRAGHMAPDLDRGFYSLLYLAQAIGEHELAAPIRLGVITSGTQEVTGDDLLNPITATAVGLCGVIPREYPNIASFAIDLPPGPADSGCAARFGPPILGEFRRGAGDRVIAFRGRYQWRQVFTEQTLPPIADATANDPAGMQGLRRKGVYLITGGTGGIGLAMARHLAETCQAHLVLTKRKPIPPKTEWRQALESSGTAEPVRRVLRQLLDLEALGADVDVHVCEAVDFAGMQRMVSDIVARYGAIHGVIHAAGIIGLGLIQLKRRQAAEAVMASKVDGGLVLWEALKDTPLDFVVFCSSLASITLPYAHADYCAAHSFMDALARYWSAQRGQRTIVINWPIWREVGILANMKAQAGVEDRREDALRRGISTAEGVEIFKRAMSLKAPQLIVSAESLESATWAAQGPTEAPPTPVAPSAHPQPDAPSTTRAAEDLDLMITATWKKVLGVHDLSPDDNFFDLGGHSLLLIRAHAELKRQLNCNLSLLAMFQHPTVKMLARHLRDPDSRSAPGGGAQERAQRYKQAMAKPRAAVRR